MKARKMIFSCFHFFQDNIHKVNPVRKDGALTPSFLLRIEALFYIVPAINGRGFLTG
jgi:hypothetical protein